MIRKGRVELYERDLTIRSFREFGNLKLNAGNDLIGLRLGSGTPAPKFIAVGSSAVAPAATQTGLSGEFTGAGRRPVGSFTHTTGLGSYQLFKTGGPGTWTGTVQESGLANKVGAGTAASFLNRGTFGAVTKAATDSLKVSWYVSFAVALMLSLSPLLAHALV